MKKGEMPGGDAQDHRIRITLTSTNTANVEKGKQHSHFSFPPPPFSLSFLKNTTPLFLLLLSFVSGASPSSAFLRLPCSVFYWPFFLKKSSVLPPILPYPAQCGFICEEELFDSAVHSTVAHVLELRRAKHLYDAWRWAYRFIHSKHSSRIFSFVVVVLDLTAIHNCNAASLSFVF